MALPYFSFIIEATVPQLLSIFLVNGNFPRTWRLSADGKSDNEMKPRDVYRSPGIYLTTEENLS